MYLQMLNGLGKNKQTNETKNKTHPRIASSLSMILLKDNIINLLTLKRGQNHVFMTWD